jgi:t-SNARE complex subunit (syntaxin)
MTEQELQNAIKELSKLDNATLEKALEKVHGTELSKARMMQLIEDYRYIETTMKQWFRQ